MINCPSPESENYHFFKIFCLKPSLKHSFCIRIQDHLKRFHLLQTFVMQFLYCFSISDLLIEFKSLFTEWISWRLVPQWMIPGAGCWPNFMLILCDQSFSCIPISHAESFNYKWIWNGNNRLRLNQLQLIELLLGVSQFETHSSDYNIYTIRRKRRFLAVNLV